MKFRCPEPSKKCFTFENFRSSERRLTQLVRVPLYEILVFLTNFFFLRNEITLRGKKCLALFQTQNWEKSSFFNAFVCVFARIYANTWQGGHNVPPLFVFHFLTFYQVAQLFWQWRSQLNVSLFQCPVISSRSYILSHPQGCFLSFACAAFQNLNLQGYNTPLPEQFGLSYQFDKVNM